MGESSKKEVSETKAIVEALYDKFLMRDIFAKIIPGLVVLLCALTNTQAWRALFSVWEQFTFATLLFLSGAAWVLGFAIQQCGVALKIIIFHPASYANAKVRYDRQILFRNNAPEYFVQRVERYALIKEACGNGSMAILFGVPILVAKILICSVCFGGNRESLSDPMAVYAGLFFAFLSMLFAFLLVICGQFSTT